MSLNTEALLSALVALAIGLMLGLERERSRAGRRAVPVGIRTFALVGLAGNLLSWLPETARPWGFAAGLAFTGGLVVVSYLLASRRPRADLGITSEFALFTCFVLGILTGVGYAREAVVIAIAMLALLHYKRWLHRFSRSLSVEDMRMAIQFLVVSLIVLPLLPDAPLDPFGALNPRRIWMMVVLISGIGFAAYAAIKLLGDRAGLGLTGLLGGLVSSTAVTMAMSRIARARPQLAPVGLAAIVLACASVFPRVALLSLLFTPELALRLAPTAIFIASVAGVQVFWLWRKSGAKSPQVAEPGLGGNPLSLKTALGFGALYALVLLLSHVGHAELGEAGMLAIGVVSGLTDVDAITLSVNELAHRGLELDVAARTVLLACASNTVVKLGLGIAIGGRQLRPGLILTLGPMAVAAIAAAFLV